MVKLEFRTNNGVLQVFNPVSQKWVKANGPIGKKLIGKDVCRMYQPVKGYRPKEHQSRLAKAFMKSKHRGLTLQHGLGSGKTCTYSEIIDTYLSDPDNPQRVFIITSGSLRDNFLSQYCSFCGKNREDLLKIFTFISYNYTNVMAKLPDLNDSLIIIDEVHNILNSKVNGSDVISDLYDRIEQSNSRIVAGSGTLIISNIEELYFLMKLIKPEAFKSLPDFYSYFTKNSKTGIIKPKDDRILKKKLEGVIDSMKVIEDHNDPDAKDNYPRVTIEEVFVPIADNEERLERIVYWRQKENSVIAPPVVPGRNIDIWRAQKTRYYLAISLLHSRQTSNFLYPIYDDAILLTDSNTLQKTMAEEDKDRRLPEKTIGEGGWIDPKEIFEQLPEIGEKINNMLEYIIQHPGKHVIFTSFRSYYGENLIAALLDILNISYLTFDGDMNDQQRQETLKTFNSDNNVHGEKVKVLIVTEAGAEGITLLAVRYQHILEQSITEYTIQQAMGRANRYKSHFQLPVEERTLHIRRYFLDIESVFNAFNNTYWSPDVVSYEKGKAKQVAISYIANEILPMMKIK